MGGTNLRVFALVVGLVVFYALLANAIPQVQSEVPQELTLGAEATSEQLMAAGEQLYQGAGGCTACHGLGTRAPNLLTDEGGTGTIGSRCSSRVAGMDCEAYLWQSLTEPSGYVVAGYQPIMQDMRRTLSEAQLWTVVAYLQSLGGEVTVTGAKVVESQAAGANTGTTTDAPGGATGTAGAAFAGGSTDPAELISAGGCNACHVLNGQGGPIGPPFDGMGGRVDEARIRRGILEPSADTAQGFAAVAGVMPATFGQQFNAAQLESLVRFLAGLK
jgi:mono/diheme cytochrome c family protein